jgi:hypothetical protein
VLVEGQGFAFQLAGMTSMMTLPGIFASLRVGDQLRQTMLNFLFSLKTKKAPGSFATDLSGASHFLSCRWQRHVSSKYTMPSAPFHKCSNAFFLRNGALPQGLTPRWRSITLLLVA